MSRRMRIEMEPIRMTILVREAIERAGGALDRPPSADGWPVATLADCPACIEVVHVDCAPWGQHLALRLADEPHYPGEMPAECVAWWERGDWVPCHCGAALVWDEAGRVPGSRLCMRGHAVELTDDGRAVRR